MNTNTIMLCGFYMIFGIYSLAFNTLDNEYSNSVIKTARQVQTQQWVNSAAQMALVTINKTNSNSHSETIKFNNENIITYDYVKESNISGKIYVNSGDSKLVMTIVYWHNHWKTDRVWIQ